MPEIMEIAKQHNLLVLEDSAQSHGHKYKVKMQETGAMLQVLVFILEKI